MELINEFQDGIVKKNQKERGDYIKKNHSIHDLSGCMRAKWYKFNQVEQSNPINASGLIKTNMGHMIEEWFLDELNDQLGKYATIQKSVKGEKRLGAIKRPIHYIVDGILIEYEYPDYETREIINKEVIEVKSSYGQGIARIVKEGKPKEEHALQLYSYMVFEQINKGRLVYLGRDSGYRAEFTFEIKGEKLWCNREPMAYIQELFELELARLEELEDHIDNETKPKREYKACIVDGKFVKKFTADKVEYKEDWQCGYCSYRDLCWKNCMKPGKYYGETKIKGDNNEIKGKHK